MPCQGWKLSSSSCCCSLLSHVGSPVSPPAAEHHPALVTALVILCWATLLGTLPPPSHHQLIYAVFVNPAVLPCLPLRTTPLSTCRLSIMRALVTLKILANWGFLAWESSVRACLKTAIKKNKRKEKKKSVGEVIFLSGLFGFLKKRKKRVLQTSYAWGCYSRMSALRLKLWSHQLVQVKNTHTGYFL